MTDEKKKETEDNNAVPFPDGAEQQQPPTLEQKVDFLLKSHIQPERIEAVVQSMQKDIRILSLRQDNLELKLLGKPAGGTSEGEGGDETG